MTLAGRAAAITGAAHVLAGADCARYATDWTGKYVSDPLFVVRPADTAQVSALMRLAQESRTPVVPVSGNTGVSGGTCSTGAMLLSLERLNRIREIRPQARLAVVEAGVVLETLHEAAGAKGLRFPLSFGAQGSAMIGGVLSTNAGGSGVLRHGNARALTLGIEAVMADGRVMNLMSALHKDNSGYDLRDLLVGAEGTLGIITAAVLKLVPLPTAFATATVAFSSLDAALDLLNSLQAATGDAVEAFEYMPRGHFEALARLRPDIRPALAGSHDVTVLVEIAASGAEAASGRAPVAQTLEDTLAAALERGKVRDAAVARNEAQRREMWAAREAAAELAFSRQPAISNDIALPLDRVATFFERVTPVLVRLDPAAESLSVAHLGDGNIHYTVYPGSDAPELCDAVVEAVEDVVLALGGSFSAEHGVGLSKRASMARRKDPVALEVMRAVKAALDPAGILNPGKVLP